MDTLSAYELTRAEQIRKNNAYLLSLGLLTDAKALKPKPKPKAAPKPKPAAPSGPARRSSRLDGLPPEEDAGVELDDSAWKPPDAPGRDPLGCWWTISEDNPEGDMRRVALSTAAPPQPPT